MKNNKIYLLLLFIVVGLFYGCPSTYEYKPSPFIISLWYDAGANELYVLKGNNILVFNDASTANGHVTPARVISGAATELNYPTSLWLDSNSDQLYVASGYSNTSILVFTQASTANGNVAPARSISSTDFYGLPCWIWLDSLSNQLYVTSGYVSAGVFVITDATIANGNVVPTRKITATQVLGGLGGPFWVDSTSDQLYITHQGIKEPGSILVFDNASTINGDVTPSRVIYP